MPFTAMNAGAFGGETWNHVLDGAVPLSLSQLALFFDGSPLAFMGELGLDEVTPRKLTTNIAPIR